MRKRWLSLRPFSFPASLLPAVLGLVLAAKSKPLDPLGAWLALITSLTLHIVANLFNSYFDWQFGHDQPEGSQVIPLLRDSHRGPRLLKVYGLCFLLLAVVLIIILGLRYRPLVMLIALIGLFSAYFYTAPPLMLKKRGLSLPAVFITMGILLPLNAYMIQADTFNWQVVTKSTPLALLITAILQGNELRDYHPDLQHGISSFTTVCGLKAGIKLYQLLIALPYILVLALVAARLLPILSAGIVLSSRFAAALAKKADQHDFTSLDSATAKLYTAFSALYILAQVFSR